MTSYQKAQKIYKIIKDEEQPAILLQAAQELYNAHFKVKNLLQDDLDDIDKIALKLEKIGGSKKK